ncbi:hypothetical protein JKX24_16460 [Serratia proteamaculans]|uniref:Uncharacterized protein n=1 Tax=Serratia proteamaculans TaxID=28151 RepID=A0A7U0RLR5_SERPR|nr:hypothetical protein [Serratia proteamaculans]MBO1505210.1 hypothetical protein [Serratia proteamaculans]MDW5511762.1 hypothetical protein [Serratia proteamaculans]QQX51796.1 hypothetical protein JKX24_16460 [Serratia proteamaculans]
MMRDRTPYTNEELLQLANAVDDFNPRRAATFRELAELRKMVDAALQPVNENQVISIEWYKLTHRALKNGKKGMGGAANDQD